MACPGLYRDSFAFIHVLTVASTSKLRESVVLLLPFVVRNYLSLYQAGNKSEYGMEQRSKKELSILE
jgi:hypothetical protein